MLFAVNKEHFEYKLKYNHKYKYKYKYETTSLDTDHTYRALSTYVILAVIREQ